MIDLTPLEVRQKKGDFRRSLRGYDAELVNDFLDLVADRMEELVKQNMDLQDAVGDLREELGSYRKKEQSLSDALMTAQQLRDEARGHAEKEGELLVREARLAAEAARQEATKALAREEETLRQVRARRGQLVESFRRMLERELNELEVIEEALELEAQTGEARAAGGARPPAPVAPEPAPGSQPASAPAAEIDLESGTGTESEPELESGSALEAEPAVEAPVAPDTLGAPDLETPESASPESASPEPESPAVEQGDGLLDIESFETEPPRPPRRRLNTSETSADESKQGQGEGKAARREGPADDEDEDDLQEDWLKSLVEE